MISSSWPILLALSMPACLTVMFPSPSALIVSLPFEILNVAANAGADKDATILSATAEAATRLSIRFPRMIFTSCFDFLWDPPNLLYPPPLYFCQVLFMTYQRTFMNSMTFSGIAKKNSPAFPKKRGAVSFYSLFASRYRSYPPYISRRQTISKPLARALLRLY